MGLTLLAGPANAGKVALLLDRYLADLPREPVLIVPTGSDGERGEPGPPLRARGGGPCLIVPAGSDVERVERDLLRRSGALLGGSISTFDDVFSRIAAG